MHSIAMEENFISGETLGADYHHAVINTDEFSSDYIQKMQYIFNLELNFVYNQDMMAGNYSNALLGFNNVIKVKPDHAIAYYYGAKCHQALGNKDAYENFKQKFKKYANMQNWKNWLGYFRIQPLN